TFYHLIKPGGFMRFIIIIIAIALLGMFGCGGGKQTIKDESGMPSFVLNPPKAPGKLFGTGIAKKASPQLAKEIADLNAKKGDCKGAWTEGFQPDEAVYERIRHRRNR
ncbi:MAG: hypothetical protein ABIA63_15475, partial [bacterium]